MATAEIKGGDKLALKLAQIASGLQNGKTLRAGFLRGSSYPDGTPVAMVAAIQDFGAPAAGIPPRPFFRNAVKAGRKTWGKALEALLKANGMDSQKALAALGEVVRGDIQHSITEGDYVPLKPATVRRKGSAKPLIDKATMINSVDYEVT